MHGETSKTVPATHVASGRRKEGHHIPGAKGGNVYQNEEAVLDLLLPSACLSLVHWSNLPHPTTEPTLMSLVCATS